MVADPLPFPGTEIDDSSWYQFADTDAAQALIGAVLISRRAMAEVLDLYPKLRPTDFTLGAHQAIWTGMLALHYQEQVIDAVLLKDWLRTHNRLAEALTDLSDLNQYVNCCDASEYACTYAGIVWERSINRQKKLKHEAAMTALINGDNGAYQRLMLELQALDEDTSANEEERFQAHSLEEILQRPVAPWVWRDMYRQGTRWVIYGPSYSGKSLLAGDLALSFATGLDWQEEKTLSSGTVLYIAAEDAQGIASQAKTWLTYHGKTFADVRERFHLIEDAVDLLDPADVARLIRRISAQEIKPDLVIIDTFTECFAGDVIDNRQLRLAFQGIGAIERAFSCGSITIAHSNKAGVSWLGGQYTKANVYGMAELTQDENGIITLRCEKLRGAPKFKSRAYRLQTFTDEQTFDSLCVLVPSDAPTTPNMLRPRVEHVLRSLTDGMRASEWQRACGMEKQNSSFYDARDTLTANGYVTGERGVPYYLTDKGKEYISRSTDHSSTYSTSLQKHSNGADRSTGTSTPLYSTPPIGGGVSGVEYPTVRYSEQVQLLPSDTSRYGALNSLASTDGTSAKAVEPLVFTEEVKKLSNPQLQAITPDVIKQARVQRLLGCLPPNAREWNISKDAAERYVTAKEPAYNGKAGTVLWTDIGQAIAGGGLAGGQAADLLEQMRKAVQ